MRRQVAIEFSRIAGIAIPPGTRNKPLAMSEKRARPKRVKKVKGDKAKEEPRPQLVALGLRLQALREQAGITQQDLATAIGVGVGAISHWERGLGAPGYENLNALAKHFGMGLDGLTGAGGHVGTRNSQMFHEFLRTPEGRIAHERGWLDQILKVESPQPPTVRLYQMITNAFRMSGGDDPGSRG